MRFKVTLDKILEKFGSDVRVRCDNLIYETKAMIQPMRYKNKLYLNLRRTELGVHDAECYLYLGPAVPDFVGQETSAKVMMDIPNFVNEKIEYNVSRADRILIGNEVAYIWAVLTPRSEGGGL